MEALIAQSPFVAVSGGIVTVIVGVAAGMYMLDQWRDKKAKNRDDADDRLNGILEKTVGELGKKVAALEKREQELTKEVASLRDENTKYLAILQGRDEQTQKFYEQAFNSMKVSQETHVLVKTIASGMENTNENIKKLIELLSKHADVLDHSISKQ
jgi:hypothetical protein